MIGRDGEAMSLAGLISGRDMRAAIRAILSTTPPRKEVREGEWRGDIYRQAMAAIKPREVTHVEQGV